MGNRPVEVSSFTIANLEKDLKKEITKAKSQSELIQVVDKKYSKKLNKAIKAAVNRNNLDQLLNLIKDGKVEITTKDAETADLIAKLRNK